MGSPLVLKQIPSGRQTVCAEALAAGSNAQLAAAKTPKRRLLGERMFILLLTQFDDKQIIAKKVSDSLADSGMAKRFRPPVPRLGVARRVAAPT